MFYLVSCFLTTCGLVSLSSKGVDSGTTASVPPSPVPAVVPRGSAEHVVGLGTCNTQKLSNIASAFGTVFCLSLDQSGRVFCMRPESFLSDHLLDGFGRLPCALSCRSGVLMVLRYPPATMAGFVGLYCQTLRS